MFLFIGTAILIAGILYAVSRFTKQKLDREFASKVPIPGQLGIHVTSQLRESVRAQRIALTQDYQSKIKKRYYAEHPKTNEALYNHYFFELQRFLLMCSLAKNVPMFSTKVDALWHEMIMFTKDYEMFCKQFCGQLIHHTPNDTVKSDPSGRAWFDLLYTELFKHTMYSKYVWGEFFQSPLSKELIEDFLNLSHAELAEKYFRKNADEKLVREIIESLTRKIKVNVNRAKQNYTPKYVSEKVGNARKLAEAMIFMSYKHPNEYNKQMKVVYNMPPVNQSVKYTSKKKKSSSSSSCSSYGCSSDSSCSSGCGGGD